MSGTLAGLQAERDMLLRSAGDRDAELSSLRQQVHSLQSSLDQERERYNRELEALRAQLQQQVWDGRPRGSDTFTFKIYDSSVLIRLLS